MWLWVRAVGTVSNASVLSSSSTRTAGAIFPDLSNPHTALACRATLAPSTLMTPWGPMLANYHMPGDSVSGNQPGSMLQFFLKNNQEILIKFSGARVTQEKIVVWLQGKGHLPAELRGPTVYMLNFLSMWPNLHLL